MRARPKQRRTYVALGVFASVPVLSTRLRRLAVVQRAPLNARDEKAASPAPLEISGCPRDGKGFAAELSLYGERTLTFTGDF